jgi:hypothetical protein
MDRRILPVLLLLLLPPATRAAGDAPLDRATLHGLKGVGVVIDVIDPDLQKLGITRDTMLNRLLARLPNNGISIDPGAAEFLGLRLTAVHASRGPFAVSMTIGLYQPILLSRDHDVRTATQTWEVETVLLAEAKVLPSACAETADDLADRFAAAYHSVNP